MYKYGLTKTAQTKPDQSKGQAWKKVLPYLVGGVLGGGMGVLGIPVFGGQWKTSTILPMAGLGALAGAGIGGLTSQSFADNNNTDGSFLRNLYQKAGGDPKTYDKIVNVITPSKTTAAVAVTGGAAVPASMYGVRNYRMGAKAAETSLRNKWSAAAANNQTVPSQQDQVKQLAKARRKGGWSNVVKQPGRDIAKGVRKHPFTSAGLVSGLILLVSGLLSGD